MAVTPVDISGYTPVNLPNHTVEKISLVVAAVLFAAGIGTMAYCSPLGNVHVYTGLTATLLGIFTFIPSSHFIMQEDLDIDIQMSENEKVETNGVSFACTKYEDKTKTFHFSQGDQKASYFRMTHTIDWKKEVSEDQLVKWEMQKDFPSSIPRGEISIASIGTQDEDSIKTLMQLSSAAKISIAPSKDSPLIVPTLREGSTAFLAAKSWNGSGARYSPKALRKQLVGFFRVFEISESGVHIKDTWGCQSELNSQNTMLALLLFAARMANKKVTLYGESEGGVRMLEHLVNTPKTPQELIETLMQRQSDPAWRSQLP
ncbi:MAG: hypothetical protein SP1CHLAM14_07150 [Chlamydiales bacterium]|nr:hypothetical protein [Chlamydiales bacterium]